MGHHSRVRVRRLITAARTRAGAGTGRTHSCAATTTGTAAACRCSPAPRWKVTPPAPSLPPQVHAPFPDWATLPSLCVCDPVAVAGERENVGAGLRTGLPLTAGTPLMFPIVSMRGCGLAASTSGKTKATGCISNQEPEQGVVGPDLVIDPEDLRWSPQEATQRMRRRRRVSLCHEKAPRRPVVSEFPRFFRTPTLNACDAGSSIGLRWRGNCRNGRGGTVVKCLGGAQAKQRRSQTYTPANFLGRQHSSFVICVYATPRADA